MSKVEYVMVADLNKLPNGISDFDTLRKEQRIYVDKTDLIYKIASNNAQPIFFSRPRRFGKSLLVSTFECLFLRKLELFKGLKIEPLWKDTKQYCVLHLDFSAMDFTSVEEFKKAFNNDLDVFISRHKLVLNRDAGESVSEKFIGICDAVGDKKLVLLIDEYDAPLTAFMNNKEQFEKARTILSSFYQAVKSRYKAVRFMFITGITRYSNTSIFSAFNNLLDLSLNPAYGALLGYTQSEIDTYFKEYLEAAAKVLNTTYEDVSKNLKEHYDGYCFERKAKVHVYNTWSVINFLYDVADSSCFSSYWGASGAYTSLVNNYLKDFKNCNKTKTLSLELLERLKELDDGIVVQFDAINRASNPMDMEPVVMMYQAGYLTIKKTVGPNAARFGIPNLELQSYLYQNFYDSVIKNTLNRESPILKINIDILAEALIEHDSKCILESIDFMVNGIPTDTKIFNDENSLREIIYREFLILGANVDRECLSGFGRADIIVKSDVNYYVFELKLYREGDNLDNLMSKAIEQVENRNYGIDRFKKNLYRYVVIISKEQKQVIKTFELPSIEL